METEGKKVPYAGGLLGLLFLLGLAVGVLLYENRGESDDFFGNIAFCESFDKVTAGKQPAEMDFEEVLFYNGQEVPYAQKDGCFYISQDMEMEEWEGELRPGAGYEIYLLADDMWNYKKATIASGHPFPVLVVKGMSYRTASLVVTGLPILSVAGSETDHAPQILSLMTVSAAESYEGDGNCEDWGQTGDASAKCAYEITLQGESKDSTWMLYPFCDSLDKVLGKMAGQIWEEMRGTCDVKMDSAGIVYVELIINQQYQGIYGLQEDVEENPAALEKSLGASEENPGALEEMGDMDSVIDYELCWQILKAPDDPGGQTEAYRKLLSAAGPVMQQRAGERWNWYRKTIFSEEHLRAVAQTCMEELTFSGALTREASRWPEAENTSDLTEVCQILEQRLAFWDKYYRES